MSTGSVRSVSWKRAPGKPPGQRGGSRRRSPPCRRARSRAMPRPMPVPGTPSCAGGAQAHERLEDALAVGGRDAGPAVVLDGDRGQRRRGRGRDQPPARRARTSRRCPAGCPASAPSASASIAHARRARRARTGPSRRAGLEAGRELRDHVARRRRRRPPAPGAAASSPSPAREKVRMLLISRDSRWLSATTMPRRWRPRGRRRRRAAPAARRTCGCWSAGSSARARPG